MGSFGDPTSPNVFVVSSALLGSNQSIAITAADSIIIKPLCPEAFVIGAMVTVTGATKVDIIYMDNAGTQVGFFSVS